MTVAAGWLRRILGGALALAGLLAMLQPAAAALATLPADHPRAQAAALVALAWLGLCAAMLARHRRARPHLPAAGGGAPILLAYASQTGQAERIAGQTAAALAAAGRAVRLAPLGTLDAAALAGCGQALLVVSTTGEGDAPDAAAGFVARVMPGPASLAGLQYGLLALGDRSYRRFCGFGRSVEDWLRRHAATPLFETIEVDDGDAGALARWQHAVAGLGAAMDGWQAPALTRWRLAERRLLNPGSQGEPVYLVALTAAEDAPAWQAGDIAEVAPPPTPGEPVPARRDYSIASLPADGRMELVVRRQRRADGGLGLASGWLTRDAPEGTEIRLALRANGAFRPAPGAHRAILIGNGTGIAGLRAHLKARAADRRPGAWLIFGERSAAQDALFDAEIALWQATGVLDRATLVFSRDQAQRRYVQHALADEAHRVLRWIEEGAVLYVCGSRLGMAEGVDAALAAILGRDRLTALAAAGRYRRDVY